MSSPIGARDHGSLTTAATMKRDIDRHAIPNLFGSISLLDAKEPVLPHVKRDVDAQARDGETRKPRRNTAPQTIDLPKIPTAAETALVALKYVPTPLLVLSSLKTVILANEAMGRLLGVESYKEDEDGVVCEEDEASGTQEMLYGQTLSQIGVDMIQSAQPIWVSWEV